MMRERYIEHFKPLVAKFKADVSDLCLTKKLELKEGMPGLALPLFGESYEGSKTKILFVGIDDANTLVDLKGYIDKSPEDSLDLALERFDPKKMINEGGKKKLSFWRFVKNFMALLYKKDEKDIIDDHEIVNSFGWSNVFPIIEYKRCKKKLESGDVKKEDWDKICEAGNNIFYGFKHLRETLRPRIVILTYKDCKIKPYLKGYRECKDCEDYMNCQGRKDCIEIVKEDLNENLRKDLKHYKLRDQQGDIDVFHTPHPRSSKMGRDLVNKLSELVKNCGSF